MGFMAQRELPDLRSRYYDWCSAQIAEYLLQLPAGEVQPLLEAGCDGPLDRIDFLTSTHPLAERLIRTAYHQLSLPPFEAWAEAYRVHPERYERELLGIRAAVPEGSASGR